MLRSGCYESGRQAVSQNWNPLRSGRQAVSLNLNPLRDHYFNIDILYDCVHKLHPKISTCHHMDNATACALGVHQSDLLLAESS